MRPGVVGRLADIDQDGDQKQRRQHQTPEGYDSARMDAETPFPTRRSYRIRIARHSGIGAPCRRETFWAHYPSITSGTVTWLLSQACPNPGEHEPPLMLPFLFRLRWPCVVESFRKAERGIQDECIPRALETLLVPGLRAACCV
jgi:hypothetical protein